ncbi:MAG: hypothetical protein Q7S29_00475 [Candidatus Peribacter sp.]|nr:hypothetical protein [Candidatus Peribacter sp.]
MPVPPGPTPVIGRSGVGAGGRTYGAGGAITERADDAADEAAEEEREELLTSDRALLLLALDVCTLLLIDCDEAADDSDELLEVTDELVALLGDDDAAVQIVMVTVSVVTVPPNARAIPVQVLFAPTVMPAGSMTIPANVVLAASVVAWVGVQNTLHADVPTMVTIAPAVDVSAPLGLKMYVPLPLRTSGPPTFIAPTLQYTPGT